MNKNDALKILDFSKGANPSKRQITVEYRKLALKFHPDKNQDKEEVVRKECEEMFKQLGNAYEYLTSLSSETILGMTDEDVQNMTDEQFDEFICDANKRLMQDLNQINSANLQTSLYGAILNKDVEYLRKLFSKFKSSKDGQFGDYINKFELLSIAVLSGKIEIVELLLKNGADPNGKIKPTFLSNSKIEKLLIEYGRVDKSSVFCQLTFACLAGCMAFAIYSSCNASFLCYVGVAAFALAGVLLVAKAIHDVFYVQTKWPSPDLDEVSVQEQGTAEGRA